MKYLGILKDSLLETIDSKVFYVVGIISILAIALMATVTVEPVPSSQGFQRILTDRFPDGAIEVTIPIVGKMKATPSFTRFSVQELKGPENTTKPWAADYDFIIESRDLVPLGGRFVVLQQLFRQEEAKEQAGKTGRRTRWRALEEEMSEEVQRIQEQEEKKGKGRMEAQQDLIDRLNAYVISRLEQEVKTLKDADLEEFVRTQMELQGWQVREVKLLDLPAAERTVQLKTKVAVKEGDDVRIKTEEKAGEINKYLVKVTPRDATYLGWPHNASLLFGAIPLSSGALPGKVVAEISKWVIFTVGSAAIMLLACIITAFFIPNMLRKGTIDLLLAKPITRSGLLFYKYIGGLTFMVINTTILILGLWLVLGLRTGVWEPTFLLAIPILAFEFAFFYALSTLLAVLTQSSIVCILGCILSWVILFPLGWGYYLTTAGRDDQALEQQGWGAKSVRVVHTALPHYLDLDWLSMKVLKERVLPESERSMLEQENKMFNWGESLLVTTLYTLGFLGLACWRFSAQDY